MVNWISQSGTAPLRSFAALLTVVLVFLAVSWAQPSVFQAYAFSFPVFVLLWLIAFFVSVGAVSKCAAGYWNATRLRKNINKWWSWVTLPCVVIGGLVGILRTPSATGEAFALIPYSNVFLAVGMLIGFVGICLLLIGFLVMVVTSFLGEVDDSVGSQ